jgi:hypothetical protein
MDDRASVAGGGERIVAAVLAGFQCFDVGDECA